MDVSILYGAGSCLSCRRVGSEVEEGWKPAPENNLLGRDGICPGCVMLSGTKTLGFLGQSRGIEVCWSEPSEKSGLALTQAVLKP